MLLACAPFPANGSSPPCLSLPAGLAARPARHQQGFMCSATYINVQRQNDAMRRVHESRSRARRVKETGQPARTSARAPFCLTESVHSGAGGCPRMRFLSRICCGSVGLGRANELACWLAANSFSKHILPACSQVWRRLIERPSLPGWLPVVALPGAPRWRQPAQWTKTSGCITAEVTFTSRCGVRKLTHAGLWPGAAPGSLSNPRRALTQQSASP